MKSRYPAILSTNGALCKIENGCASWVVNWQRLHKIGPLPYVPSAYFQSFDKLSAKLLPYLSNEDTLQFGAQTEQLWKMEKWMRVVVVEVTAPTKNGPATLFSGEFFQSFENVSAQLFLFIKLRLLAILSSNGAIMKNRKIDARHGSWTYSAYTKWAGHPIFCWSLFQSFEKISAKLFLFIKLR